MASTLSPFALVVLAAAAAASASAAPSASATTCNAEAFASLTLDNINILSLDVAPLRNQSLAQSPGEGEGTGVGVGIISASTGETVSAVDICKVSIRYTHPGQGDNVNTWVGLPLDPSAWNSRFIMTGGGGWTAGSDFSILAPVASGYTTSSTDGGHNATTTQAQWGLVSEGNTNWPALNDFASVALDEAAKLGKAATRLYFGRDPAYSYWNGCSTGGRQGHMMAQRFPEQFDGILASCSAINWPQLQAASGNAAFLAQLLGVVPPQCVLDAFSKAALDACDELDGVKDNIIALPGHCNFNASEIVGQHVDCINPNGTVAVTDKMAQLVQGFWDGPRTGSGDFFWYGFGHEGPFSSVFQPNCTSVDNCTYTPFSAADDWYGTFLERNSTWKLATAGLTQEHFDKLNRMAVDQYTSAIGTSNVDLTDLKARGTKMITWHGTHDGLIPYNGTVDYYNRVMAWDPNVQDYYRFFLAPGVGHCRGGPGFDPNSGVLNALISWVENGTAPEFLPGTGPATKNATATRTVNLCMYPKVLTFVGPDPDDAASFRCI